MLKNLQQKTYRFKKGINMNTKIQLELSDHEAWVLTEALARVIDNNVLDDNELERVANILYERLLDVRS